MQDFLSGSEMVCRGSDPAGVSASFKHARTLPPAQLVPRLAIRMAQEADTPWEAVVTVDGVRVFSRAHRSSGSSTFRCSAEGAFEATLRGSVTGSVSFELECFDPLTLESRPMGRDLCWGDGLGSSDHPPRTLLRAIPSASPSPSPSASPSTHSASIKAFEGVFGALGSLCDQSTCCCPTGALLILPGDTSESGTIDGVWAGECNIPLGYRMALNATSATTATGTLPSGQSVDLTLDLDILDLSQTRRPTCSQEFVCLGGNCMAPSSPWPSPTPPMPVPPFPPIVLDMTEWAVFLVPISFLVFGCLACVVGTCAHLDVTQAQGAQESYTALPPEAL